MAILQSDGVNNATDLILRRNGTEGLRLTSSTVQLSSINDGPLAGFRNRIINGNFDFWQRGTSFTGNEYGADRWVHARVGTTQTATREPFELGQTDVPGEPTYYCRTVVISEEGASNYAVLAQRIEDVRTFAGQQVTVSFWAKADATKNIAVNMIQYFGTGGLPSANVTSSETKISVGTTFQKVTVTATLPSISDKTLGTDNNDFLQLNIWFDAGSNFNSTTDSLGQQSGTFEIAQVQLEPGPVATPFEQRPIGTELALCQRYYCKQMAHAQSAGIGFMSTPVYFPVEMRAIPNAANVSPGSAVSASATALIVSNQTSAYFQIQATGSGGYVLNRLDAYSAEL
jgi:hypothetical protein